MDEGRKGREGREGNLFDDMYENLRRPADRPVSPVIPHTKKQEKRLRKYRKKKEKEEREESMIPDNADEIGSPDIDLTAFATDLEASDEETEEEKIRRIARELRNTKKLIATSIGYTLSS